MPNNASLSDIMQRLKGVPLTPVEPPPDARTRLVSGRERTTEDLIPGEVLMLLCAGHLMAKAGADVEEMAPHFMLKDGEVTSLFDDKLPCADFMTSVLCEIIEVDHTTAEAALRHMNVVGAVTVALSSAHDPETYAFSLWDLMTAWSGVLHLTKAGVLDIHISPKPEDEAEVHTLLVDFYKSINQLNARWDMIPEDTVIGAPVFPMIGPNYPEWDEVSNAA